MLLYIAIKVYIKVSKYLDETASVERLNWASIINSGVDIKAVSARLGHCNISITADTYGHIFDAYQARIAQSIEDKLL